MRQSHSGSGRSSSESSERSSDASSQRRLYEKEAKIHVEGIRDSDVFFGSQYNSDTNLAAYSGRADDRETSTPNINQQLSMMSDSAGMRKRRYASADGYHTPQNLHSSKFTPAPEKVSGKGGWLNWFGHDPLTQRYSDDKERSQSTPASSILMRQVTMEQVEGVDDTPLSSKRSCSEFIRDDSFLDELLERTDTLQSLKANVDAHERPRGLFGLGLFSGKNAKKAKETIAGSASGTKSSLKRPSHNKPSKNVLDATRPGAPPRKVTFQEQGVEEEEKLSFLVESLGGRSLSTGGAASKERTRSTTVSVTGPVGANEIPEATPKKKRGGMWGAFWRALSPGERNDSRSGSRSVEAGAWPYSSPTKSEPITGSKSGTTPPFMPGDIPSTPPTHYMHVSPPRSSLLLESEREAKNMLSAIFGDWDDSDSAGRTETRSRASRASSEGRRQSNHYHHQSPKGNPEQHQALHTAMLSSGVEVEQGVLWGGIGPDRMEIELKPLPKSPQRGSYSSHASSRDRASGSSWGGGRGSGGHSPATVSTAHSSYDSLYNLFFYSAARRGLSGGSQSDQQSLSGYDLAGIGPLSARSSFASHYTDGSDGWGLGLARSPRARTASSVTSGSAWSDHAESSGFFAVIEEGLRGAVDDLVEAGRARLMGPDDAVFADFVRVMPSSAGGYMRGMLVTGIMSLFFHVFTLALWPRNELSQEELVSKCGSLGFLLSNVFNIDPKNYHPTAEAAMYGWVVLQVVLNTLQTPSRFMLHVWSWRCSRAIEAETSLQIVQTMIGSDIWIINRMLGRIIDLCAAISIVCCELYLWGCEPDDPLRPIFVSLGATSLLAFIVRLGIAIGFTLSAHDPTVLAEARRRGLSKWDVSKLPNFVFTDYKEVNNKDCSICLASFDLGEMVTMLPCDQKHSFHTPCIQEWLERQNSCPLCQKMV